MSFHSPSEIPIVSKRGSVKNVPLSMRDIMTDPSMIDKKLRLLSQNGSNKTHLSFLKYKFNPGDSEYDMQIPEGKNEQYGQLKVPGK